MERERDEVVRDGGIILIVIVKDRKSEQDKDREGEKYTAVALSCKKMK